MVSGGILRASKNDCSVAYNGRYADAAACRNSRHVSKQDQSHWDERRCKSYDRAMFAKNEEEKYALIVQKVLDTLKEKGMINNNDSNMLRTGNNTTNQLNYSKSNYQNDGS